MNQAELENFLWKLCDLKDRKKLSNLVKAIFKEKIEAEGDVLELVSFFFPKTGDYEWGKLVGVLYYWKKEQEAE